MHGIFIKYSAMGEGLTRIRVRAEGIGIMSKTMTTCLVLWYDSRKGRWSGELALLAFAAGQLAYGASVFAAYLAHFRELPLWSTSTCVNVFHTSLLSISEDPSLENG